MQRCPRADRSGAGGAGREVQRPPGRVPMSPGVRKGVLSDGTEAGSENRPKPGKALTTRYTSCHISPRPADSPGKSGRSRHQRGGRPGASPSRGKGRGPHRMSVPRADRAAAADPPPARVADPGRIAAPGRPSAPSPAAHETQRLYRSDVRLAAGSAIVPASRLRRGAGAPSPSGPYGTKRRHQTPKRTRLKPAEILARLGEVTPPLPAGAANACACVGPSATSPEIGIAPGPDRLTGAARAHDTQRLRRDLARYARAVCRVLVFGLRHVGCSGGRFVINEGAL